VVLRAVVLRVVRQRVAPPVVLRVARVALRKRFEPTTDRGARKVVAIPFRRDRMFDLTDVKFVKRVVVGSDNPNQMSNEAKIDEARALLNRCLTDSPRGSIIGVEKSFTILQIGEHQVVLQWICYHVGFPRKPSWLVGE
jgi:hypothetical protein